MKKILFILIFLPLTIFAKLPNLSEYNFKGKDVYVKVWASFCPYCIKSLPDVEKLSAMKDKKFDVITVVIPKPFDTLNEEELEKFVNDHNIKAKVYIADIDFAYKNRVKATPFNIFIHNGKIIFSTSGVLKNNDIINVMNKISKGE